MLRIANRKVGLSHLPCLVAEFKDGSRFVFAGEVVSAKQFERDFAAVEVSTDPGALALVEDDSGYIVAVGDEQQAQAETLTALTNRVAAIEAATGLSAPVDPSASTSPSTSPSA